MNSTSPSFARAFKTFWRECEMTRFSQTVAAVIGLIVLVDMTSSFLARVLGG